MQLSHQIHVWGNHQDSVPSSCWYRTKVGDRKSSVTRMIAAAIIRGYDYYLQKAQVHIQQGYKCPERHEEWLLVILREVSWLLSASIR